MTNFVITKSFFGPDDLSKIDKRFLPFLTGWEVKEVYKGSTVVIPKYNVFEYFEYTDTPGEEEKQVSIWCGWDDAQGLMDAEVIINLRLEYQDAINPASNNVKAEILKDGGAPMEVYFNGKLVTNFSQTDQVAYSCPGGWFSGPTTGSVPFTYTNGYQTVGNMPQFL